MPTLPRGPAMSPFHTRLKDKETMDEKVRQPVHDFPAPAESDGSHIRDDP